MTQDFLIKLEDIWKVYQLGEVELAVLKGVSLQINAGDFMTIMGPSGSGKSTLLHIAGFLDVPTKGKVMWKGEDIAGFSEDEIAEIRGKKVGFVFQQFNLIRNLSALENVTLPMVFQGVPESKRKERARTLLNSLGMGNRLFHKPTELSGGEQQRVAIARALSNDPEIIVADEPTGNLDSATGAMIMDILKKLHQEEKKTIIVVTHDPHIAEYAKNIINIQDGKIIANHLKSEKVLWEK